MKTIRHFLCFLLAIGAAHSASAEENISYEINAEYGYVGGVRSKINSNDKGDVDEQSNLFHVVVSPRTKIGLIRIGAEWQRYSFGLPNGSFLPNTLQSTSLIIGLDTQYSDALLIRIEAQPGIYSDFYDVDSGDFNIPFIVGGSYLYSEDLQFVLGASVDVNRSIPVFPGAGIRWKFAEKWVLNAILPRPRLEYTLNNAVTLYAGADLRGGTYRVGKNFGTSAGNSRLDNAVVEYTEIRVSAGASWKIAPSATLEIETGCMAYREFDFHRADISMSSKSVAPYGQVALSCRF
jgi:hypothetical protein